MVSIEATLDLPQDFTTITVVGKVKADDVHEWQTRHYARTVTSLHLWDLTKADLSEISTGDIIATVERTKMVVDKRKGGKSALVCRDGLEFGLCRMGETYSEIHKIPVEYQTFRSLDQAREWLGIIQRGVVSSSTTPSLTHQ